MKIMFFSFYLLLSLSVLGQPFELCYGGIDEDGDGLIDCQDSDCHLDSACISEPIYCFGEVEFFQTLKGNEFASYLPSTMDYVQPFPTFANTFEINAIGYNTVDNYVYGVRRDTNLFGVITNNLVRVGADGVYIDLGPILNLPLSPGPAGIYYIGDCDTNGDLFVYDAFQKIVFQITNIVSPGQPTAIAKPLSVYPITKAIKIADFSYHPKHNRFFGLENQTSRLVFYDPSTNVMDYDLPLSPPIGAVTRGYGASYVANDELFFFRNENGNIHKVDISNYNTGATSYPASLFDTGNDTLKKNDGASCPYLGLGSATCCKGENLLENGDFELGHIGFQTDYSLDYTVFPGQFAVIFDGYAPTVCDNWVIQDHSGCTGNSPNNRIMVVNGQTQQAANLNNIIWQTDGQITVQPNELHVFCYAYQHLPQCCFDIEPKITIEIKQGNGAFLPMPVLAGTPSSCGWVKHKQQFFTSSNSIEIRMLLNETDNGDGNDFALDDFFLGIPDCDSIPTIVAPAPSLNNQKLSLEPTTNEITGFKVYPNPFSDQTTIEYQLTEPGFVNLQIIDITGKKVKQLVHLKQHTGTYQVLLNTAGLSPGVYSARLEANDRILSQKLIVIKD